MPWPVYSKMTDEDLKAVFAYLKTLPPVRNFVRASPPRFELSTDDNPRRFGHPPFDYG